jgi:ABC-type phosphate transport system substrate-binding protein
MVVVACRQAEGRMDRTRQILLVAGVAVVVAACGASVSPSQSIAPSVSGQASTAASGSSSLAPSPSPSPSVAAACDKVPKAFNANGVELSGAWAGDGILGDGTLNLKIEDDGTGNLRIVKVSETGGGFGNSSWTPCKPG